MLRIPSFFLYIDFYSPLFYVLMLFIFINFSFKFFSYELSYKFLVDIFPCFFPYFLKNNKCVDIFLNKLNLNLMGFFSYISYNSVLYLKSSISGVVFLITLLFFLVWVFSIILVLLIAD